MSINIAEMHREQFDLLEAILGRDFLQSFIVFSPKDSQLLSDLCRKKGLVPPTIYKKRSLPRYKIPKRDIPSNLHLLMDCFVVHVSKFPCFHFA